MTPDLSAFDADMLGLVLLWHGRGACPLVSGEARALWDALQVEDATRRDGDVTPPLLLAILRELGTFQRRPRPYFAPHTEEESNA